jgi:hypothetical protein
VIAEKDFIVLYGYQQFAATDKDYSDIPHGRVVASIFPLEGGKIVEHRDVLQAIPERMAHENTIF